MKLKNFYFSVLIIFGCSHDLWSSALKVQYEAALSLLPDQKNENPSDLSVVNDVGLVRKKARPINQIVRGITPLHLAVQLKQFQKLQSLIEAAPEPKDLWMNSQDDQGATPLMYACAQPDNVKVIQLLLQNQANPNAKDSKGTTPLMYACAQPDNVAVIRLLLQNQANLNAKDRNGLDALDYALKIPDNSANRHYMTRKYFESLPREEEYQNRVAALQYQRPLYTPGFFDALESLESTQAFDHESNFDLIMQGKIDKLEEQLNALPESVKEKDTHGKTLMHYVVKFLNQQRNLLSMSKIIDIEQSALATILNQARRMLRLYLHLI